MKRYAVIVAGGTGSRMNAEVPKQFMLLNGVPVIFYSIQKFAAAQAEIVVVMNTQYAEDWKEICEIHKLNIPHTMVNGGSIRSQSVLNGLQSIVDNNSIVAVHDAARPVLTLKLIEQGFAAAQQYGSAIPVVDINESIRNITPNINIAVNRDEFKIVQTPQCFNTMFLKNAFAKCEGQQFTDEASMFESAGNKIHTIEGEPNNIKITRPADLFIASQILLQHD